jgi:hypothetical protein
MSPGKQKPKPDHHLIITEKDQQSTARRIVSGGHSPGRPGDSSDRSPRRDSTGFVPSNRREPGAPRDRRPSDIAGEGAAPVHLKKKKEHHSHGEHKDAHAPHHKESADAFHHPVELAEGHNGIVVKSYSDGKPASSGSGGSTHNSNGGTPSGSGHMSLPGSAHTSSHGSNRKSGAGSPSKHHH